MSFVDRRSSVDLDFNQKRALRDQELVAKAKAGSSAAFAQLRNIYEGKLYSTVIGITKNREDAEDVLQDTFLRAYMALRGFEGRSTVYSWLTRIAINSALMILRRRRTRAEVSFDCPTREEDGKPALEIKDAAPNPEQLYDQRQRTIHLMRSIKKLAPNLRVPIEITLAQECSMKEIARTLDISVAAVKARLHRARGRLTASRVLRYSGAKGPLQSGLNASVFSSISRIESSHA